MTHGCTHGGIPASLQTVGRRHIYRGVVYTQGSRGGIYGVYIPAYTTQGGYKALIPGIYHPGRLEGSHNPGIPPREARGLS